MHRVWGVAAAVVALAAIAGCRHLPSPRAVPECPGVLVVPSAMGDDFRWRASARVVAGSERFDFQVIAEKRGDELLLVGLHPLGAKLFGVRQHGTETEVSALPGAVLPVPPLNVLRDLHRIRFAAASSSAGDDVEVVRAALPPGGDGGGGERLTLYNPACGVTAVYTSLPEPGAP